MKRTGKSKVAVVGWGRGMGHTGHMYLADAVIQQAADMKADPYFFISKTVGKDDPIYPEEKVKIYQRVFPKYANIFSPQGNLNQALTDLSQLGYDGVVVVVGADQKQAFQYLEKPNKEGVPVYQTMGFKKLKVISRQETRSKFANEEGPRATPMREILMNPAASEEDKFQVWRRDMPKSLSDEEVLDLMHKAEQRMKVIPVKAKKLKEFITRVRPLLKEASFSQKLKVMRLIRESMVNEPAPDSNNELAEAIDREGYHTSVSKGKFLPSKYGQDENNLYLHDMMNSSHDGSGPKIVTIDDKRIATEVAAMYGGYVEKTGLGTYRIYKPRGVEQKATEPELSTVNEEQNPRIDLTPNFPNYNKLVGEFIGVQNNKLLFNIVSSELKPGVKPTEKIDKAIAANRPIALPLHYVKNRKVMDEADYEYLPPGASPSQTRKVMNKINPDKSKFIWKKPNQIGGSFSEQELLSKGFKKSQYNSWGGTQEMWNRLLSVREGKILFTNPNTLVNIYYSSRSKYRDKPVLVGRHIPYNKVDAFINMVVSKYDNIKPTEFIWTDAAKDSTDARVRESVDYLEEK